MGENLAGIKFGRWETPFEAEPVEVLTVAYGSGSFSFEEGGLSYVVPPIAGEGTADLTIRIFHHRTKSVFKVLFEDISAFRVLDEHGLMELWNATASQGGRPGQTTFRVKNHGWSRESPLSFWSTGHEDGSFLIATDWECIEVLCRELPAIELEVVIAPQELDDS